MDFRQDHFSRIIKNIITIPNRVILDRRHTISVKFYEWHMAVIALNPTE